MPRFVDLLIRLRWPLLAAAVLLTVAAWPVAERLEFDQSIESLYALDDPHLLDYQESKALFAGDEFVIVAWKEPDLLQSGETPQLTT
ncbi:MAG: efflux RND transporter permease subunit, partial [Planctomycetaceae bacterium]